MKPKLSNLTTGSTDLSTENGPQRCVECGTSDTPLWRLGPSGPKTMCNACGIRWKRQNANNGKKKRKIKKSNTTSVEDDEVDVINPPLSPEVEKRNLETSSPMRPEGSSPFPAGTLFHEETDTNPNLIVTEIDYNSLLPSEDNSSEGLLTSEPSDPESLHSDGSLFDDDIKKKRPRKKETKRRRETFKKTTKKRKAPANSEIQLRKHSFFQLASCELDKLVEAAEVDRRIIDLEERISVMQQENATNRATIQNLMKELEKKDATIHHLLSSAYMAPSGASPESYLPSSPNSSTGVQTYWEPAKTSRNQISVQNLLT